MDEIILKEVNLLISEYNNITLDKIEILYKEKIISLDGIFSFSNIKSKINEELDTFYNSELFFILNKTINNDNNKNNNQGLSDYDFPTSIINDINTSISEGIIKIKEIMKKIEGNNYEINDKFETNFENINEDVINKIKSNFNQFTLRQSNKENSAFDNTLTDIVSDDFNNKLNNIIPTFSVDFFERILKINEIENIKPLFNKLKYILFQTKTYYQEISESNNGLSLPPNIIDGIMNLNNIESLIELKSKDDIFSLNSTLNNFIENEKTFIIQKYIGNLLSDSSFKIKFSNKIYEIITKNVNQAINVIEGNYIEKMKNDVFDPFIIEYKNILNKLNEDIYYNIQNYKNTLQKKLRISFSFDINSIVIDIQNKLKEINLSIEEYQAYFDEFKISNETIKFFEEIIIDDDIIPIYNDLNSLIFEKTLKYVINNIEHNSNKYKNKYSIEIFEETINVTKSNFFSYIDKDKNILNNYGTTYEKYKTNLQNEMNNYNNGINNTEQKGYYKNYEISFKELNNISFTLKQKVINSDLFSDIEQRINEKNNINYMNNEYKYIKYIISLNKNDINAYFLMLDKLDELKDISYDYYSNISFLFTRIKEQIIKEVIGIDNIITYCNNITSQVINEKYIDIKNYINTFQENGKIINNINNIPVYSYPNSDNIIIAETNASDYTYDYRISLDFINDEKNKISKIIGSLKNIIKINSFNIDSYPFEGPLGKIGKKINFDLNDIYLFIDFEFDAKYYNVTITTSFNLEEFSIKKQYYEERITTYEKSILGINFLFEDTKKIVNIEIPENEKSCEIPSKNKTIVEKYYF